MTILVLLLLLIPSYVFADGWALDSRSDVPIRYQGATAPLPPTGAGRIYYNPVTGKWESSENGSVFRGLVRENASGFAGNLDLQDIGGTNRLSRRHSLSGLTWNLVDNPSFELGNTGWILPTGHSIVSDSSNARTGNWVLTATTASNTLMASANNDANLQKSLQVVSGEQYVMEFWAKMSAGGTASARGRLDWYDKDNVFISSTALGDTVLTTTYQRITATGTAPATAVFLYIRMGSISHTVGTVYIDDVRVFKPTSEQLAAQVLSAAQQVSVTQGADAIRTKYISSASGNVTLTSNPQITAGSPGQILNLCGSDTLNTITVVNGNGVTLGTAGNITFNNTTCAQFEYTGTTGPWREITRTPGTATTPTLESVVSAGREATAEGESNFVKFKDSTGLNYVALGVDLTQGPTMVTKCNGSACDYLWDLGAGKEFGVGTLGVIGVSIPADKNGVIDLLQKSATPATPPTGYSSIYAKSDGIYTKNPAGVEAAIGGDISARISRSTSQTVLHDTVTAVLFTTEQYDTASIHDLVTNTDRMTFATAGKYLVTCNLEFQPNATGVRDLGLYKNGTTRIAQLSQPAAPGAAITTDLQITTIYSFAATEWVNLQVYQNSTVSLNLQVREEAAPVCTVQRMN